MALLSATIAGGTASAQQSKSIQFSDIFNIARNSGPTADSVIEQIQKIAPGFQPKLVLETSPLEIDDPYFRVMTGNFELNPQDSTTGSLACAQYGLSSRQALERENNTQIFIRSQMMVLPDDSAV